MEAELAILALLVAGYALIAARLDRFSVGPAIVFLFIGILLSDDVLGGISIEPEAEPIKLLSEATLTLLLFADASTIRVRALQKDARPSCCSSSWGCCSRSRSGPSVRCCCSRAYRWASHCSSARRWRPPTPRSGRPS